MTPQPPHSPNPISSDPLSEAVEPFGDDDRELGDVLRGFRDYLVLVAERDLQGGLQGKLDASDLVQETFLLAQRNWQQFRGTTEQELLGWLRQILQNHMVDVTRRYRGTAKRQILRERSLQNPLDSQDRDTQIAAPDASPRSDSIAREEEEALQRAMSRLPEHYRRAVILRNWERLSFEEIGRQLNRSADAARKLWSRAVESLQHELDEVIRDGGEAS